MGLFEDRVQNSGKTQVPVWFMRQAGRYHDHYQNLKKTYDFMTLCKDPKLACEVTMGPIEEFDFDAAILFSDLLFPLEQLGMGLTYNPGPILEKKLEKLEDISSLPTNTNKDYFNFQKEACELLKKELPANKTLLGFVGAPFTLYAYAVEGSHAGSLFSSKTGLYDGRYEAFCERLLPNVLDEMILQAQGGADAVCIFDTAVGELTVEDFKNFALPKIKFLTREFKAKFPNTKIVYYSRNTHKEHLRAIQDDNIDVMGVDWRHNLAEVINEFGKDYYIQGNFDPCWLGLPWETLENKLASFYQSLEGADLSRWICGLGHGVLRWTPQENVAKTVEYIHKNFRY
ncbi:MAG: uroporphyrinogen decarboxylase [Halobacteriovoraceae bacterium]|nr:uroporphyrinogen decarboxylase [Halobacteriovoraceae bacterium]|tara:strand:- start:9804 stop:10832 length:1029 start_codon:yes stop_codon:yes gene_type:complete